MATYQYKWRSLAENREILLVSLLIIASVILWGINLGGLPLRDWDEGTYANVAREMYRSGDWLHPKLYGQPFLDKPPLVEWLIAASYTLGGISELTTRLPLSFFSSFAPVLLYWVGKEVFPQRLTAFFAALVYLTLLPVVRHGRLAMHDGIAVSFFLLLLLCWLKARQQRIWGLGVGIALGLLILSKGILGLLLGAIAVLFFVLDGQLSGLANPYLWVGMVAGNFPAIAWYLAQSQSYGERFWETHFISQSFERIWQSVDRHDGPPWYYLLEILKYAWPWVIFWPGGLHLAGKNLAARNLPFLSSSRLILIGTAGFLGAISVMRTKLPWYIMPLYPFLALAVGAKLAQVWQSRRSFPFAWAVILGFLTAIDLVGLIYLLWSNYQPMLLVMGVAIAITLGAAAWLVKQQNRQFILVLFSGVYLVLGMFVLSPLWVWELNEAFPVKPVADLIRQSTPPSATIYTSFAYSRPSLDFYSDRQVIPASTSDLVKFWSSKSYLLLDRANLSILALPNSQSLGIAEGFTLIAPQLK